MKKYIEEEKLFDEIKKLIYGLCPVKKPRIGLETDKGSKRTMLIIDFYFYKDKDDLLKMHFNLTKNSRGHNDKRVIDYDVDKEISYDTLGKLVAFLITEFPYLRSLDTYSTGFEMEFQVGIDNWAEKGISCNEVTMVFGTHPEFQREFEELFRNYLDYIAINFNETISKMPQFRKAYNKYRSEMKFNTINSFTNEELQQFISLLSDEQLKMILFGLDNDSFFKLYDMLKEHSEFKGRCLSLSKKTNYSLKNN